MITRDISVKEYADIEDLSRQAAWCRIDAKAKKSGTVKGPVTLSPGTTARMIGRTWIVTITEDDTEREG